MNIEMLINRNNRIVKSNLEKIKLVNFTNEYAARTLFLEENTFKAFNELKEFVFKSKAIIIDVKEGYRSPNEQQALFDATAKEKGIEYARSFVALPYASEHNAGLAVDYVIKQKDKYNENIHDYYSLKETKFINENAHEFGFILRYQKDKTSVTYTEYKPWHLRYVGKQLATKLYMNNLALEENYNDYQLFLDNAILGFDEFNEKIAKLLKISKKNNDLFRIREVKPLGKTNFGYDIRHFTAGIGEKDIVVSSTIHGCEIITLSFMLEYMYKIAKNDKSMEELLKQATMHFIPLYNPEGFIITTSMTNKVLEGKSKEEITEICKKYFIDYKKDDEIASKGLKSEKLHRNLFLNTTYNDIPDKHKELKENIKKLIENYNIPASSLATWSSNGMGVDLNKNHPHNFDYYKKEREENPYDKTRYNDLNRSLPGPFGYIGNALNSNDSIENKHFLKFIDSIAKEKKLLGIYFYHSAGALIYIEDNLDIPRTKKSIKNTKDVGTIYSSETNYTLIDKVSSMSLSGYLRCKYNDTVVLVPELSRIWANPIGPYSDMCNYRWTIITNIKALTSSTYKMISLK